MKILLINSNQLKAPYPVIPIGLCYIASFIETNGYNVKVLDLCFINDCKKAIEKAITEFKPTLIGITIRNIDTSSGFKSYFLINDVINNVTSHCKKYFSGPIVVGGPAVGINPEEILDYLDLEYAIYGDGEYPFLEFVKKIENNKIPSGIKGLIIRKNKKTIEKNDPYYLDNLDMLPFPRPYKYLDLKKYKLYNTNLQIQTKRGCPLKCSYCTYNNIEGHKFRFKSPDRIADEIEDTIKNSKIKNIEIVDSIFNIPIDNAKNVLKAIIKKNIKLNIFSMVITPKDIDEEFVELLKKAKVSDVAVGIESCNDRILKNLGKNFQTFDIIKASKVFKKKKIKSIQWFLLLGAEGESYSTINETFKSVSKVVSLWDVVFLGIGLRVYNNSPISKRLLQKNNEVTKNNFFEPFGYEPENIDLKTIKIMALIAFFKYHNFFMYDEKVQLPLFFRLFLKYVFPKFPLWKPMIYTKFLLKITGVSFIITKILELIYKEKINKAKKHV